MTDPKPKGIGRPSSYTEETADLILERIAAGESVSAICRDPAMPSRPTLFRWLHANEDFRNRYARATELRAEAIFDEMFEIADETSGDFVAREDGSEAFNAEHVQRSKLRIETRKWALAKMMPKKFGDKTLVGSDPDNPLPAITQILLAAPDDDAGEG
jgi:hypothetical protein